MTPWSLKTHDISCGLNWNRCLNAHTHTHYGSCNLLACECSVKNRKLWFPLQSQQPNRGLVILLIFLRVLILDTKRWELWHTHTLTHGSHWLLWQFWGWRNSQEVIKKEREHLSLSEPEKQEVKTRKRMWNLNEIEAAVHDVFSLLNPCLHAFLLTAGSLGQKILPKVIKLWCQIDYWSAIKWQD